MLASSQLRHTRSLLRSCSHFPVARGLVAPDAVVDVEAAADRPLHVFNAQSGHAPVTVGVDVAVVPLRRPEGGALVLLDMEGIGNFDHDVLSILLGFLTQITGRLAFVTGEFHDDLFAKLSRTAAAASIVEAVPGQVLRRVPLHLLFNSRRVDPDFVTPELVAADARFEESTCSLPTVLTLPV